MNQNEIEVVNTISEYIPKLEDAILKVIENITSDKLSETINIMSDIIDGLQWVHEASSILLKNKIDRNDNKYFNKILGEVYTSYENNDSILAKDLLKYEFLPLIKDIQNALSDLE